MVKEIIGGKLVVKDGPVVPVSKAVRAGDFLYVSGQLAYDDSGRFQSGTIEEETERVLKCVSKILSLAQCGLSDVVKCTCWITREEDFARFNSIYSKHFAETPPARSTVISQLMFGAKVEIEVVAYKKQS